MDSFSIEQCRHIDALERVRYFSGQLLGAADFQDEQQYLRDRARLHNRMLHGWGVVSGLEVSPTTSGDAHGVIISPGLALDPCGREIIVPESVSLVPLPVAQPAAQGSTVTISICYAEQPVGEVSGPAPAPADQGAQASRILPSVDALVHLVAELQGR